MTKLALIRPDVADKFESVGPNDVTIHTNGYSGKLSKVTLKGAEALVKSKSGLLIEKPGKEAEEPSTS